MAEARGFGAGVVETADRVLRYCTFATLVVSSLAIGVLALLGTADIVGVSLFERSIPSAIELMEATAAVAIAGAMGAAQYERANIEVDILTGALSDGMRRFAEALAGFCGFVVFAALFQESAKLAIRSLDVLELNHGFVAFPIYPFKILVAVGFGITALQFLRLLLRALLGRPTTKSESLFPQLHKVPEREG
ncbi:TRAP transporter small permease [Nitratireductor sp. ZSWI3]|uniref:TRAP transporter small permease n=1 Tax=Nitratireductor sp. ZSWI3 TaxID=2966359 RepID=UPI00215035F7|nr:TRAP transporter small permease [Nitratireductor sp. ZSWI3]MCR4265033.1 TRAP transporter small permease [Nitratireductor sp. ZSWI3]